jgi:hypothetical protein
MGNQFKSVLGLLLVHAFLTVQASGDENLI